MAMSFGEINVSEIALAQNGVLLKGTNKGPLTEGEFYAFFRADNSELAQISSIIEGTPNEETQLIAATLNIAGENIDKVSLDWLPEYDGLVFPVSKIHLASDRETIPSVGIVGIIHSLACMAPISSEPFEYWVEKKELPIGGGFDSISWTGLSEMKPVACFDQPQIFVEEYKELTFDDVSQHTSLMFLDGPRGAVVSCKSKKLAIYKNDSGLRHAFVLPSDPDVEKEYFVHLNKLHPLRARGLPEETEFYKRIEYLSGVYGLMRKIFDLHGIKVDVFLDGGFAEHLDKDTVMYVPSHATAKINGYEDTKYVQLSTKTGVCLPFSQKYGLHVKQF